MAGGPVLIGNRGRGGGGSEERRGRGKGAMGVSAGRRRGGGAKYSFFRGRNAHQGNKMKVNATQVQVS